MINAIIGILSMSAMGHVPDDDGVIITIPKEPPVPITKPHSAIQPLATGYFDYETNELSLTFLENVGVCTISVTSVNSEFVSTDFDTAAGTLYLSLSGESGLYMITVESPSGLLTNTTFLLF